LLATAAALVKRLVGYRVFVQATESRCLLLAQLKGGPFCGFSAGVLAYGKEPELFEAELVLEFRKDGVEVLWDPYQQAGVLLDGLKPLSSTQILSAVSFDQHPEQDFSKFEQACSWVKAKAGRRISIGRRVQLPPVDLAATFASLKPEGKSRAMLHISPEGGFSGCSPELLAEGTCRQFSCYRLAGSGPPGQDLLNDLRLVQEHQSGLIQTRQALQQLGEVEQGPVHILKLPGIQHLATELSCRPIAASPLRCLQAVLPAGVSPVEEGRALLESLEPVGRGAFYGLAGVISPEKFSFSQVLRCVFTEGVNNFVWAGAAITPASTPELELEETRLKLSTIPVVLQ
jgi:isochorismate synthase EntC